MLAAAIIASLAEDFVRSQNKPQAPDIGYDFFCFAGWWLGRGREQGFGHLIRAKFTQICARVKHTVSICRKGVGLAAVGISPHTKILHTLG